MSRVALKQIRTDGAVDGDVVQYNSATGDWEPADPAGSVAAAALQRLIITTWGGIVYNSNGELVLKGE
jgi:hypothetical protein